MLTLVVRRLLLAIPNIVLLTALLYISVSTLLGNPTAMMLGEDADPESIAALNRRLGFDRPVLEQYVDWMWAALQGDFGRSYTTRQSVADAILPRIPVTLELGFWAILIATLGAIILNTLNVGRRILTPAYIGLSMIGITVPNFMLGISLIYLLSVSLGWLPSTGWVPWSDGVSAHLKHLVMPVITLAAFYFGSFSLVYRAEYKDVLSRLFIQVARAKGLAEWRVAFGHALPNAILPVITVVGVSMGRLTGGAVVTESVFSIPGIGRLFVNSIGSHDFTVMLALGMLIIIGVIIMNLLADILYTIVNPQIRFN